MPNKDKQYKHIAKGISLMTQIAFSVIACVSVGVLGGWFFDNLFGTSPWLIIIFSLLGAGAAFKSMYDIMKNM
ncbi:MAG: AtpZ/AtpI family protein [Oscillospiraceae bacterium]|nr:AtpZ/AtpI family protein [Oscillospiraceae bacterium]